MFVSQMEKENIVSECVVVNVRMLSRCQLERERERELMDESERQRKSASYLQRSKVLCECLCKRE